MGAMVLRLRRARPNLFCEGAGSAFLTNRFPEYRLGKVTGSAVAPLLPPLLAPPSITFNRPCPTTCIDLRDYLQSTVSTTGNPSTVSRVA